MCTTALVDGVAERLVHRGDGVGVIDGDHASARPRCAGVRAVGVEAARAAGSSRGSVGPGAHRLVGGGVGRGSGRFLSPGPGWGKTTLLAQWASRSRRPFAWLSADEDDNDPIVLLTYVAAALDRVSRLDPRVFEALALPGVSVEGTVVPRLGAALATMDEAVVLVLDDLDLLDSPACLDAIVALTRHVPEGSQLTLSARGESALPLRTLRARGLTLEIGQDEVRMDEAEARELLRAAGMELADGEVAELTERTEGWPAACTSPRCRPRRAGAEPRQRPRSGSTTAMCPTIYAPSCSRACRATSSAS
jgi:hypothetical protein